MNTIYRWFPGVPVPNESTIVFLLLPLRLYYDGTTERSKWEFKIPAPNKRNSQEITINPGEYAVMPKNEWLEKQEQEKCCQRITKLWAYLRYYSRHPSFIAFLTVAMLTIANLLFLK